MEGRVPRRGQQARTYVRMYKKRQSSSSVPRNPVRVGADELDTVIDRPERLLCRGPPAPALLVVEDHRLLRAEIPLVVREHLDVEVRS